MEERRLHSVMAEFTDVNSLMAAAERVRDAGFRKWDCHTPFPVHGLDDAMGVKMTRLPWVVLAMGLTGCGLGLLLQWWTNAYDYPYIISGKPLFSLPANIPVTFEVTVLFSAFTAFFAMWIMNDLPRWFSPLSRKKRFARATDDRFFVVIEAADPQFDGVRTSEFLNGLGAASVEEVEMPDEPSRLPARYRHLLFTLAMAMLVPLAMIYNAQHKTSTEPRVHLVKDMDKQARFRPQGETLAGLFADGRMTRPRIEGTVGRGMLTEDEGLETGMEGGEYVTAVPSALQVDEDFVRRGQERFGIYCAPCHGFTGKGDGLVHQRAMQLAAEGNAQWVQPTDLGSAPVVEQADGRLYETIRMGRNTMPAYAQAIPVEDRWAIVLYMSAHHRAVAQ
jgi:mono/diheme cytochrome c family protein